jgi:hypothetical protein
MKIRKINKKSQSLMISYVILISIVIAISIGVFVWLKNVANIEPPINCKEGTSVITTNITCTSSGINLTLKNNGRFSVEGMILTISNESELTNPTYLVPHEDYIVAETAGSIAFLQELKPGEETSVKYRNITRTFVGGSFDAETPISFSEVKSIQVQPFIYGERGVVICQDALIKQEIDDCFIAGAFNPLDLPGLISWWKFDYSYDDSINGNTLNPTGGPLFVGRKSTDDAINFDGETQYAQATNPIQLEGKSYSISL